jgi:DNA uptake protein ComE-like DNA-binding protein
LLKRNRKEQSKININTADNECLILFQRPQVAVISMLPSIISWRFKEDADPFRKQAHDFNPESLFHCRACFWF